MTEREAIRIASENVEAWSAGNWERLKAAVAPDVTYDEIGGQRKLQGAEAFVNAYQGWKAAGPDGKGTITNAFAQGNSVLIEVTWTATALVNKVVFEAAIIEFPQIETETWH